MKIIIGERGKGKTTELIKLSHKRQYAIICHNQQEKLRILTEADKLNLLILTPITIDELLKKEYRGRKTVPKGFLIDNLESLFQNISPYIAIRGFSITDYNILNLNKTKGKV